MIIILLLYPFGIKLKKNETSSAQGKREFTLLDDDNFNDDGKFMNLLKFSHLGTMKIPTISFFI